jgi:hypothetical protein
MLSIKQADAAALITTCADLYLAHSDDHAIPTHRPTAIANLTRLIPGNFFETILDKDVNVSAWMLGLETGSPHHNKRQFQQNYYASNLHGVAAVKAILTLHDSFEDYCRKKKGDIIVSSGSHLDERNVFARVLEKHGWIRRHYLAIKHLN